MQATSRYSASPVFLGDGAGDQFGSGAGAGPSVEAYILCEQSIARTRGHIPGPREGNPGSGVLS